MKCSHRTQYPKSFRHNHLPCVWSAKQVYTSVHKVDHSPKSFPYNHLPPRLRYSISVKKFTIDQIGLLCHAHSMNFYEIHIRQMRSARVTGLYPPCPECGSKRTFAGYESRYYYVECKGCGHQGDLKLTEVGAFREWIRFHDNRANCGGWTQHYKFYCCDQEAKVTCTGPDPRRRLSGQTVTVECQTCQQKHTAARFKEIVWSSTPNAKSTS